MIESESVKTRISAPALLSATGIGHVSDLVSFVPIEFVLGPRTNEPQRNNLITVAVEYELIDYSLRFKIIFLRPNRDMYR